MKNVIIFFVLLSIIIGCNKSDDDPDPISVITDGELTKKAKEYGINKNGLIIDSYISGVDTNQIYFNGRINQRLWIGGYDKTTKIKLIDWTQDSKLDTVFHLHSGYGVYKDFKVNDFHLLCCLKNSNLFCFSFMGDDTNSPQSVFNDLYFVSDNILLNKKREYSYPNSFYTNNLISWDSGVIAQYSGMVNICFSSKGDSLFKVSPAVSLTDINFINKKEGIKHIITSSKTIDFSRQNIETGNIYWSQTSSIFESSSESIKVDKISLDKKDNIWTYTIDYTLFSGTKKSVNMSVNIETGNIS